MKRPDGSKAQLSDVLHADLFDCYDRTSQKWNLKLVSLDNVTSVTMCVLSYALLIGVPSSTLQLVALQIKDSPEKQRILPERSMIDIQARRSLDFTLLRE